MWRGLWMARAGQQASLPPASRPDFTSSNTRAVPRSAPASACAALASRPHRRHARCGPSRCAVAPQRPRAGAGAATPIRFAAEARPRYAQAPAVPSLAIAPQLVYLPPVLHASRVPPGNAPTLPLSLRRSEAPARHGQKAMPPCRYFFAAPASSQELRCQDCVENWARLKVSQTPGMNL